MLRIAVSFHNLSSKKDCVRRTGINQVVFNALDAAVANNRTDIELVPLFNIPDFQKEKPDDFIFTHDNASRLVIEAALKEIGVKLYEAKRKWPVLDSVWEEGANSKKHVAAFKRELKKCDLFFETALVDNRHIINWAKKKHPNLRFGACLHDFSPVVCPQYVDAGIISWFSNQYIKNLDQQDFTISVSRNTAIEWQRHKKNNSDDYYVRMPGAARACTAQVPYWFKDIADKPYFLSIATLEPRKNLELIVKALASYERIFEPHLPFNIILTGDKGWKDDCLRKLITGRKEIIAPGYVPEDELRFLLQNTMALISPSHYEGFGIPVADAVKNSVDCITCRNSSLPEASRLNAVYIHPGRPDELACQFRRCFLEKSGMKADKRKNKTSTLPVGWKELWIEWLEIFINQIERSKH